MPPNFAEGQKRFGAGESRFVSANRRAIFFQPPSPPLWPSSFAGCHRVFGNITRFTSLYYLYRRGRVLTAGTWGKKQKKKGGKKKSSTGQSKIPAFDFLYIDDQPASIVDALAKPRRNERGRVEREREREREREMGEKKRQQLTIYNARDKTN